MSSVRIGQILSRLVPLSDHDVEEILQEQRATRLKFGDAALALGYVKPADVWAAWCEQLGDLGGEIDLNSVGIDAQATRRLDPAVALRYGVIPVRASSTSIVIASAEPLSDHDRHTVEQATGLHAVFVRITPHELQQALRTYYASASLTPAAA
jgi:hypothetical protein